MKNKRCGEIKDLEKRLACLQEKYEDLTEELENERLTGMISDETWSYQELLNVLHKRELLNNAMVALELDRLAEEGQIKEPLLTIIRNDAGVFGVDEALALQTANIYGTIGVTNFGYLDRVKYGIIKQYDEDNDQVNTFIDDLLGAIVAALCGKLAHKYA